jgi:hypothetical protein
MDNLSDCLSSNDGLNLIQMSSRTVGSMIIVFALSDMVSSSEDGEGKQFCGA